MRRLLVLLMSLLLAACASVPSVPIPVRPDRVDNLSFALNGRIAVRYDGKSSSAGVHWKHEIDADEILLLAPLGQTVARVSRSMPIPQQQLYTLDADGKHYMAGDAESLTEQVLGWRLPMSGLHYWVFGQPVPGEAYSIEQGGNGQVSLLRQDGWTIRYTRYAGTAPDSLPSRIALQRDDLKIKLLIDEWQIK